MPEHKTKTKLPLLAGRLLLLAVLFLVSPGTPAVMGEYSPTITVTSPAAAVFWAKGQTYEIRWDSSRISQVYIKLYKGGKVYLGDSGTVSFAMPNTGSYVWTVPEDLEEGNDYSIYVFYNNAEGVYDASGNFSITAALPLLEGAVSQEPAPKTETTAVPPPAAPALTIALDEKNSSSRLVVFGSTAITLAEVRLKAIGEAVEIAQLKVSFEDGGTGGTGKGDYTQIRKFYLQRDGRRLGATTGYAPSAETTKINLQQDELIVPEDDGTRISIVADLADYGPGYPGQVNVDLKTGLGGARSFIATGNTSAKTITNKQYAASTGSPIILRKSVPVVAVEAPRNRLGEWSVLHRAKISTVGKTGIGVYRLSYAITTSAGVKVSDLFTRLTACTGCPEIPRSSQLSAIVKNDGRAAVSLPVDRGQLQQKPHLQITAGSTATIDLYGRVGLTDKTDAVSVRLLGDSQNIAPGPASGPGNFIWSDLHLDQENTASTNAFSQWYNGYLVSGFGTTVTVAE